MRGARPDAADGDARHRAHALRGRQQGRVHHRRRRRAVRRRRCGRSSGSSRFDIGRAHRVSGTASSCCSLLFALAAAHRQLAVRLEPARHPRGRQADAGDRIAGARGGWSAIFTLSAAIAGVAGALLAQTHAVRRHRPLGFPALGRADDHAGAGRHRAALRRARRRRRLHDRAGLAVRASIPCTGSSGSACCWSSSCCSRAAASSAGWRSAVRAPAVDAHDTALRTEGLSKHWGGFKRQQRRQPRARPGRAARADRPQRRRQDDVHQPADRRATRRPRATCSWATSASPHLPQHQRVKRGMTRTFQINTLFPGPHGAGIGRARDLRAQGHRRRAGTARSRSSARKSTRRWRLLASLHLDARRRHASRATCPTASSGCVEIALALATRPAILLLDEPAAGIPAAESAELFGVICRAAARRDDPLHRARHGSRVPLRRAHHRAGRRTVPRRRHAGGDRRRPAA